MADELSVFLSMAERFETVISGVSGRFPDCESVPEFQAKLYGGKSFMSLQHNKWPVNYRYKFTDTVLPSATGKFKFIKEFDPVVFKVNNAVAGCTDVINRKVLEPSFEAVMDAGLNPYDLNGRHIGVYMSFDHSDCDANAVTVVGEGRLWVLGSSKTMMSNRVSFAMNLTGPSFTFCSDLFGSLTALHEAYNSVSQGHVEAAIVGVAAAAQHPIFGVNLSKMNVLDMDAITRVFDKNANGYGRSDGLVVLFIQRASDAKRAYASIDFTGYTYFGSNPRSFLDYDTDLLKKSVAHLYKNEDDFDHVKDVSFIEMSACGLKNYDKYESNFIADIFCKERKTPMLVGSVKSNVGNSDGAGPYVSLMKALFALESGIIVQNQNLEQIDDEIAAFNENKLKVVTKPTALSGEKIMVNSVGVIGALSQVILKRNPKGKKLQPSSQTTLPRLVLACSRTEDGIWNILHKVETTLFNPEFISLVNDTFGTDMPYHVFRGYTVVSPNTNYEKKNESNTKGNKNRPIWFLFSGMGSQWNTMGKGLLDLPIIAETVEKCHRVLQPKGVDIYHILTTDDPTVFDNIMHSFVGIITIQIALVEVLKALGIKPDGIIGHSVGENACAYADGCLTLEQAVLASYARGMASIETETIKGMMAAVGKGYNEIKDALPETIEVACHNSSTSCTLSGPTEDVENYVKQLQEQKIFAKAVNVANIAYHSKHIAPAAPNLLSRLQEIISEPAKRSSKWVSTSVPESEWHKPLAQYCSAEYLTNNLLNSVLFEEGSKHIPPDALVIEIAPHGLLQAIMKRSLPTTCTNVPLTRRNNDGKNLDNLLRAIGRLYIAGCDVKVNALYPPVEYPVPRETPSVAPLAIWHHTILDAGVYFFDPVGSHSGDPVVIRANDDSPYYYLKDHQIRNRIVLPTSFYLYLTWWVFSIIRGETLGSHSVIFENVELFENITISSTKPRKFAVFIQKGSGKFEILKYNKSKPNKETKIMTGVLYRPGNALNHSVNPEEARNIQCTISDEQFYRIFKDVGYQLKDTFQNLEELKYNETDCYAKIKWRKNWVCFLDSLLKFSMFSDVKNDTDLLYTHKIRKLEISAEEFSTLEEGTTLVCHKQRHTKVLTCDGLAIYEVKNKNFELKKRTTNVQLQGLRFVSYQNPRCRSVAEFYKLCLQIAVDSVGIMLETCNTEKLNIVEDNATYSSLLKHIVKECDTLKTKISFRHPKEILRNKYSSMDECYMLVSDNFDDFKKFRINSAFLLVAVSKDDSVPVEIRNSSVQVTKQKFGDKEFYLFKKKSNLSEKSVRIENEELWASKGDKSKVSFVVKQTTDSADLSLMFKESRKPTDPRYLFVMDKEEPPSNILESQQIQDLPVSVLQNGEWGSYQSISENQPEYIGNTPADIQLESVHLHYVSCDKEIGLQDNKTYNYGIEYSGVQATGERVMGIAPVDSNDPISKPDPILKWNVPNNWSLEDAVTVPFTYAKAFHILDAPVIRGKQYVDSVLINVGDEGAFCEACIAISLSRGHIVYVTVSSSDQAALLKRKFPQLDDSRIFNSQECSFQNEILKITEGVGVSVVVNCLPGIKSVKESLNSLMDLSYFIQAGKTDDWENQQLELYPFLKAISFVFVRNDVSSLMKLPIEEKESLKALVEEGIKAGIVVPFDRNVQIQGMPENDLNCENGHVKTIFKWFPNNATSCSASQKIRYDNNHSYVIVGDKKNPSWLELIEWLISKGARKFFVVADNFILGPNVSHRMNRLLNQKRVTIILSSSQKLETPQDAEGLLRDASKVAPLEAVFFVSLKSAGAKIRLIDLAAENLNANVPFVSILSGGLKECESRRFAGWPAVVIHDRRHSCKLNSILPEVDRILSQFDNSNSPTLYCIASSENKTVDLSIRDYLPHDIGILEKIGEDLSDKLPEFIEVTTKTPRYSTLKDCSPIFIISTLGPKPLKGLLSNLMSPAFCTSIGTCPESAPEIASKLYKRLNNIQSKGGVTLISETWSSPIVFEMMKLLERDGRKFKIFILDGNPLVWKRRAENLGPINSVPFENNLIAQILNLNPEIRLENVFGLNKPLLEKLSEYLNNYAGSYPSKDPNNVIKVVQSIRAGLEMVSKYEYNNQLLTNTVSIVRNHNENDSLNLSMTSKSYVHVEDNYFKFLSSSQVYSKINSDVIYTIWYD